MIHADWIRSPGLKAAPPVVPGTQAEQPMTVGQAAGRSGRDSQHVALSSRTAINPGLSITPPHVDSPTRGVGRVPAEHVQPGGCGNDPLRPVRRHVEPDR